MRVAPESSLVSRLSCSGSRCCTSTKLMPVLAGNACNRLRKASRPPADAPTPTMGKVLRSWTPRPEADRDRLVAAGVFFRGMNAIQSTVADFRWAGSALAAFEESRNDYVRLRRRRMPRANKPEPTKAEVTGSGTAVNDAEKVLGTLPFDAH